MAITAHDIVSDSPTNNFATWNALNYKGNSLLDGNLNHYITTTASNYAEEALGTIAFDAANSSVYFETYIKNGDTSGVSGARSGIGIVPSNAVAGTFGNAFSLIGSYVFFGVNGQFYSGTYSTATANVWWSSSTSYGSSFTIGDIVGVFINNGSLYYSINGSWVNSSDGTFANVSAAAKTNMTGYKVPATLTYLNGNNDGQVYLNTGQDPTFGGASNLPTGAGDYDTDAAGNLTGGRFAFQPPSGAKALCTANLPDFTPDVTGDVPQDYFKTVLYTGQTVGGAMTAWDGTTGTVNVGFQPDLVWIKSRNHPTSHGLYDSVRGVNNALFSDNTEGQTSAGKLSSFNTDGFSLNGAGNENTSSKTYIAWCFRAGGPPDLTSSPTKPFAKNGVQYETLSAANITAGTITPTAMSVNTDAGFSIVKYPGNNTVGATVPHGLTTAPEFVVIKNLNTTTNWTVYHIGTSITSPENYRLKLNATDGIGDTVNYWNNTKPNLSVVTLYSSSGVNESNDLVMYCWHSVEGYSKFGSYTGNGSTDGPMVYCGFRPAFVMIKNIDVSSAWSIFDSARDESNVVGRWLTAHSSTEEQNLRSSYYPLDFLSNGFKLRTDVLTGTTNINLSNTYIFMAFSEQSFKFSNAR